MKSLLISTFVSFLFLATNAYAQQLPEIKCYKRDNIIEYLSKNYSEQQRAVGIIEGNKIILEIWSSDVDNGSFTVLYTNNKNESCVITNGSSLIFLPKKELKDKS